MESSDYYSFMALPRTASAAEIRSAYRRLAMRFHPDIDGSAEASLNFGYLCEAYRCLSDPAAREFYDRQLRAQCDPSISVEVDPVEGGADAADEQAADQVPRDVRRQPRPGVTRFVLLRTPRRVPRKRIHVRFERRDPCPRCAGLGVRKDDSPPENWSACHACWGMGHVFAHRRLTIAYRSRRVLGGELIVPHEGDVGDHGGPRGNLMLRIVTPDHTTRGLMLPAIVGAAMVWFLLFCIAALLGGCVTVARGAEVDPLAVGFAGHAFDHLGGIADQAPAAAASGATNIYDTGFGSIGYGGLPTPEKLAQAGRSISAYVRRAKGDGIRLDIGYLCATSIVKLETFDANWTAEFRAQFATPPAKWLQQDRDGKPLASWYGGDYRPACMSNPDWRAYERAMVRLQIESGHDGIFFDNPTVHPQGCYCEHCMTKFGRFLAAHDIVVEPAADSIEALRKLAASRPKDFMRFRCTIAAEFLGEMRTFARTLKPDALVTCNNSLNSPGAFFSQCRTYGYNISEMSRAEDLVVVEDMESQPRVLADGSTIEYGPVYEMLHAIAHGKPVVAVTLAGADYHTPPNLMRLAMAEAAAHGASYLSWPTWPEKERARMIAAVRPQADLLRANAALLNGTTAAADVCVFLPFGRWVDTAECHALEIVRELSRANLQFRVVCDEDLAKVLPAADAARVLVVESDAVLDKSQRTLIERYKAGGGRVVSGDRKTWLANVREAVKAPAIVVVDGPPTVRAVVRTKGKRTIVHLLNLNVARLSSFEDRVTAAERLRLNVRCGTNQPMRVTAISADAGATRGPIEFTPSRDDAGDILLELTIPRVGVSTILVIE